MRTWRFPSSPNPKPRMGRRQIAESRSRFPRCSSRIQGCRARHTAVVCVAWNGEHSDQAHPKTSLNKIHVLSGQVAYTEDSSEFSSAPSMHRGGILVATIESERPRTEPAESRSVSSGSRDETKLSFKTTEFWAMGG